jgi:hypothetical protein
MDQPKPTNKIASWMRPVAWLGAALVLGLVFLMYREPEFMMQMANQVWACF